MATSAAATMLLAVIIPAVLAAALFVVIRLREQESPPTGRDVVAVVTFPHPEHSEHAFAEVRQSESGAALLEEVACVEVRRHGTIVAAGPVGGGVAVLPDLGGEIYDQIRADVPEGASAIVVLGSPADADAMVAALAVHRGRPTRHELTRETAQAFDALLAQAPRASHHVG